MKSHQCCLCSPTQLQVSDPHITLQQIIHFPSGLFFKFILLGKQTQKKKTECFLNCDDEGFKKLQWILLPYETYEPEERFAVILDVMFYIYVSKLKEDFIISKCRHDEAVLRVHRGRVKYAQF